MIDIDSYEQNKYTAIELNQTVENRIANVSLTDGSYYNFQVLMSVKVQNIKSGDLLVVTSEYEVTNNTGVNLQTSFYVVIGDKPDSIEGVRIDAAKGYNIDQMMHHGTHTIAKIYKCTSDISEGYINVVVYSVSSAYRPGMSLIMEKGYSHLDVLHIKQ